jgi:hypothetical protein
MPSGNTTGIASSDRYDITGAFVSLGLGGRLSANSLTPTDEVTTNSTAIDSHHRPLSRFPASFSNISRGLVNNRLSFTFVGRLGSEQ